MIADRLRALIDELRSSHGWIGFTRNDYANRLEQILAEDAGGWRPISRDLPWDGSVWQWRWNGQWGFVRELRDDDNGATRAHVVIVDDNGRFSLTLGLSGDAEIRPIEPPPQEPQP